MHTFAVTENHVVLVIFPLVVNPLSFLLRNRPFIENYRWRPDIGTRIVVLDTRSGQVRAECQTEPFFAFHHINAWDGDGEVVFDICAYPDAGVIETFYLDRLRAGHPIPLATPRRYRLSLDGGHVDAAPLGDGSLELPRIAYRSHNGRPYRYAYGNGDRDASGRNFADQLVKLDTRTGEARHWYQEATYPGEPVFVPSPDGAREDDGVVLSVALDATATRSSLVVLDASSFTELASAEIPHAIPHSFHGLFTGASS